MSIESTQFGSIAIDGKTHDHHVIVGLSGEVRKRHKKLSKEKYGTSHIISKAEAEEIFEEGCEQLILGSGAGGNVRLSPAAKAYFEKKRCNVILLPTPEAIDAFNRSHERKVGLMHVTC